MRAAALTRAVGRIQYLLGRTAESQRSYDKASADYTDIEERARAADGRAALVGPGVDARLAGAHR